MIDYKPPRRKKSRARLLSPAGYLVLAVVLILLAGGGLTVRHIVKKAHEPLPAKAQLSDKEMLRHGRENERTLT